MSEIIECPGCKQNVYLLPIVLVMPVVMTPRKAWHIEDHQFIVTTAFDAAYSLHCPWSRMVAEVP